MNLNSFHQKFSTRDRRVPSYTDRSSAKLRRSGIASRLPRRVEFWQPLELGYFLRQDGEVGVGRDMFGD